MTATQMEFILNGLILLMLGATIFFAARLSVHLKAFRDGRKNLERLIRDLGINVEKAEAAISGLRETARESGRDLQSLINEARFLSDELQIMSESGNRLAGRLEKASDRDQRIHGEELSGADILPGRAAPKQAARKTPQSAGFAIRDPEFDQPDDEAQGEAGGRAFRNDAEFSGEDELQSQAERELFEALRRSRRKTDAGGIG